ncbi:MAG: bifunctional oligoribonuclease/PAP phosphatase NrnA [Lentisphaeria bacterium]|nr:bifunctional oligoribonuclease/PAP phosphatase NrnA [Lentisphaeria bacterium]
MEMLDRSAAAQQLMQLDHILILTHSKPDGDAAGSALGLRSLLRTNGKSAEAFLPEEVPLKYRAIAGEDYRKEMTPADWAQYQAVIMLDCAAGERCASGGLTLPEDMPVLCIDHHENNSVSACWKWVVPAAAATCEMIVQLAEELHWTVPEEAATLLLLGLITDTGSFRFQNTSGSALRAAALLREWRADWDGVINAAYYSKPRNQQLLEADLMQNHCHLSADGAYAWALVPEKLLEKYRFDMRDGENLIDLLREIDTVKIAALLYLRGNDVRISLRSKDDRYPVFPVAQSFGGGGHRMAAGASLPGTLEEAAELLRRNVEEYLEEPAGEGR